MYVDVFITSCMHTHTHTHTYAELEGEGIEMRDNGKFHFINDPDDEGMIVIIIVLR